MLYGSLLGDSYAERRSEGQGTRLSFSQESSREEYLLWLHSYIADLGYCQPTPPKIQTRMGLKGKIRYVMRFHTYTYQSLDFLRDAWYKQGVKSVPDNIADYLTPMAIAIWIIDDGARVGKGLKFCTNSFSFQDCTRLSVILHEKYDLKSSVQKAGQVNEYHIYVWKESMPKLRSIVAPYILSSILYKLGNLHCYFLFNLRLRRMNKSNLDIAYSHQLMATLKKRLKAYPLS